MPRSRKAVKRTKKTVIKQTTKKLSRSMREPLVGKLWKPKQTVRANYASMGLAALVNDDSAVAVKVNSRRGTFDQSLTSSLALGTGQLQVAGNAPLQSVDSTGQQAAPEVKNQAIQELEEAASCPAPPRIFMFEGDQEFVERLISKYSDDYVKMARDRRLNPFQHTPAQIRHKVEKYNKYVEELRERGVTDPSASRGTATKLPCSSWNVFPKIC